MAFQIGLDVLSLLTVAWVAVLSGWFFRQGLKTGTVETRFGKFQRTASPVAYRCWMAVFAVFTALLGLIFIVGAIAGTCMMFWPHVFDRMP